MIPLRPLLLLPVLLFASCAQLKKGQEPAAKDTTLPEAARAEDIAKVDEAFKGKSGFHPAEKPTLAPEHTRYVVELDQQRVYLYNGGELIAASKIASGRSGYRTETGTYYIGQKDLNHRSTLYGNFVNSRGSTVMGDVTAGFDPTPVGARFQGSLMKYFQRFERGKGKPTAMGFHQGNLPGYPASHGCVRLPSFMAKWFYENVPAGSSVIVRGKKYGVPSGTKQARAKRAPKVHSSLKKTESTTPATPPAGAEDAPMPTTPGAGAEGAAVGGDLPPPPAPAPAPEATPAPAPAPAPEPGPAPEPAQN